MLPRTAWNVLRAISPSPRALSCLDGKPRNCTVAPFAISRPRPLPCCSCKASYWSKRSHLGASKSMKRVRFEVYGRVQGVFFRKCTCEKAEQLQIRGYVQNTVRRRCRGGRGKRKEPVADRVDASCEAAKHRARRTGRSFGSRGEDENVAVPRRIAHVARGAVRVRRGTKRGCLHLSELRRPSYERRMKPQVARCERGSTLLRIGRQDLKRKMDP
eukprot:scaffold1708_cov322-Pavlova_lutheri.AAC.11